MNRKGAEIYFFSLVFHKLVDGHRDQEQSHHQGKKQGRNNGYTDMFPYEFEQEIV